MQSGYIHRLKLCYLLFVAVILWLFTSTSAVVDLSTSGGNSLKNVKIKLSNNLLYVKVENKTTKDSRLSTEYIYSKEASKQNSLKLRRFLSILRVKEACFNAPRIHEGENSLERPKKRFSNDTFCNASVRLRRRYDGFGLVNSTQDLNGKTTKLNISKRVTDETSNNYQDHPEDTFTFKSNDKTATPTNNRKGKTFDNSLLPELSTEAGGFVTVKLTHTSSFPPYLPLHSQSVSMKELETSKPRHFSKLVLRNEGTRIRRDIEQLSCSKKLSCEGRCTIKESFQGQKEDKLNHCYCDELCETLFDCCYDYKEQCKRNITEKSISRKKSMNIEPPNQVSSKKGHILQCVSLPGNTKKGTRGIWMINSCQKTWSSEETRKCMMTTGLTDKNYRDIIPVIARDGKTYRNQFCAKCNGIELNQTKFYLLAFSCSVSPPKQSNLSKAIEFLFRYCYYTIKPHAQDLRRYCYNTPIGHCPPGSSQNLSEGCSNGTTGLVSLCNGTNYKNLHCALCHLAKDLVCGPFPSICEFWAPSKPFSVILDLGSSDQTTSTISQTEKCSSGGFDTNLEICHKDEILSPKLGKIDKYRVSVWFQEFKDEAKKRKESFRNYHLNITTVMFAFSDLLSIDRDTLSTVRLTNEDGIYNFVFDIKLDYHYNETNKQKKYRSQSNIRSLLELVKPISITIASSNFTILKVTKRQLSCAQVDTFYPDEYTFLGNQDGAVYINKTGKVLKRTEYYFNDSIKDDPERSVTNDFAGKLTIMQSLGHYNNSSKTLMVPNHTSKKSTKAKNIEENRSEHHNRQIFICRNYRRTDTIWSKSINSDDQSITIITMVGLSCSVVSLITVLITYCLFNELRSEPGINIMNLSTALLVSHSFWLFGSGLTTYTAACTAVSVVLHIAFLSSFMWMSIIAVDTWRTFSNGHGNMRARNSRDKRKHVLKSMAIGWLSPLILVVICFILDMTKTVAVGYGGEEACWISTGVLYVFIIPIAILQALNIVLFVLTIKAIRDTKRKTQMAAVQKRNSNNLKIYMRLASLMGFTWLIGFLSHWWKPLSYLFIIACTLQGLYIAVAFVFVKRVIKLYTKLFTSTESLQTRRVQPADRLNSAIDICSPRYMNQQHIAPDVHCKGQYTVTGEERDTEETRL